MLHTCARCGDLPNKWKHLPKPFAAKYLWRQNSSVIRKAARDGYKFEDASWFRPNAELAPTLDNPFRTVGQTFFGAERNLVNYKGWWK